MKKTSQMIPVAIAGVATGLTLFIRFFIWISRTLRIADFPFHIPSLPHWVVYWVGTANIVVFFPAFLAGVFTLKPRGAVGQAPALVTHGIYRYLRNPFYAGISFTLFGLGLLLHEFGISLAGLAWLFISWLQCRREEKELEARFGMEYIEYKKTVPRFIPDFQLFFTHLFGFPQKKNKKSKKAKAGKSMG